MARLTTPEDFAAYRARRNEKEERQRLHEQRVREAWVAGDPCKACGVTTASNAILGIENSCQYCCGHNGCQICV